MSIFYLKLTFKLKCQMWLKLKSNYFSQIFTNSNTLPKYFGVIIRSKISIRLTLTASKVV